MEHIITLNDVHRTYQLGTVQVKAVCGISLAIEKSKFISLVGPSGCGKTTMLNMIGCIDAPTQGDIIIQNKNIKNMNDNQLTQFRGRTVGFIFQNFNLIPVLNIFENISYPLRLMQVPNAEIKKRVNDIISYVGLDQRAKHRPNELSGGQRQRVAIARALVIDPKIVIADEPTANLDSESSKKIMELMADLQQKLHTTFVFATHDTRHLEYVDTIYKMQDGKIIDEEHRK